MFAPSAGIGRRCADSRFRTGAIVLKRSRVAPKKTPDLIDASSAVSRVATSTFCTSAAASRFLSRRNVGVAGRSLPLIRRPARELPLGYSAADFGPGQP